MNLRIGMILRAQCGKMLDRVFPIPRIKSSRRFGDDRLKRRATIGQFLLERLGTGIRCFSGTS